MCLVPSVTGLTSCGYIKLDGKTTAEICKMHPDCDQAKLKAMIKDCNSVEETYEGKKENCPECGKKGKVKLMACASCGCK